MASTHPLTAGSSRFFVYRSTLLRTLSVLVACSICCAASGRDEIWVTLKIVGSVAWIGLSVAEGGSGKRERPSAFA